MQPATTTQDTASAALSTAGTTPAATPATGTTIPKYNYDTNVSSDVALQDLTNFQANQKAPIDIYNEAVNSMGIPDVRTRVTALRKNIADTDALLAALPDSVAGRTSGSLVTEGQRQRILAMERAPLDTANSNYSRSYANESANLNDLTSQAQTQSSLIAEGQKNVENALTTRLTNVQSREAEQRRREEADRAFQTTLKQIEAQQKQFAEQMAQSRAQMAQQDRQFNASLAASKASSVSVAQQASSDASRLLNGIMTRKPGYTEDYILPTLASQYPELTDAQIRKIVFDNRKSQYGF